MVINVNDIQVVGETEDTLFEMIQQSTLTALVILNNAGANTTNYRFQQYIDGDWEDMDDSGTDLYNTLTSGQTRQFAVAGASAKIRLVGNASGGSTLSFNVTRYANRGDGGSLPILNF